MLRYIKLKQLHGELENLTPSVEMFFKLHGNLQDSDDFGVLYNENNDWVIQYDFKNSYFWYHYDRFYLVFKEKFDINLHDFNDLCKSILETHLNCKELTPNYLLV